MRGGTKGIIGALVLGGLLVAPGLAGAQSRGYVGVGGGVNLPIGDFSDGAKLGWLGQVHGGVTFGESIFGVRVNGTYGQNKEKSPGHPTLKLIGVTGDVVVSPRMEGNVSVYVLAGAGMVNSKVEAGSSTDFAWNAGGGAKLGIVFVEARFLSLRSGGHSSNMIPITAGVRFGGN